MMGGTRGVGKKKGRGGQQQKGNKKKSKGEKRRAATAEEQVLKWAGVEILAPGLFELHSHSTFSDGRLSPELLVARAYRNGVRVLALTDHDTMAGLPAAVQAARQFGIRVIPGIEISAKNVARGGSTHEEPVHILAYYGCCGPSNYALLEERLSHLREGRYRRAQEMVDKLSVLQKPITLEQVQQIAGKGVAPGRPHIARALVEAGHVQDVAQAFTRYLHNDGPAYATGAELPADEVVHLIRETGGISVLAHPWALKDPMPLIERLKSAGLHAMEVYRGDGKVSAFGAVAESCKLVKLGGSDFHATGACDETDLGGVELPPLAIHEFLKLAEPIWGAAIEKILQDFAKDSIEKVDKNHANIIAEDLSKGDVSLNSLDLDEENRTSQVSLTLSPWLSEEERHTTRAIALSLGLMHSLVDIEGRKAVMVSR